MCARLSTLLLQAQNPLIYAGEGVIYAGASDDLKALAELVNAPVITTLKAKGAFPENHPLFVGVRGDQVAHYLTKSDLILAVGSSLSPGRFSHGIPDAAKKTIIHCNVDELHINKMYPDGASGDRRCALDLAGAPPGSVRPHVWRRTAGGRCGGGSARQHAMQALAKYRQVMASNEKPINPYRVYGDLMQVLDPHNSFVTHESGNTRDQLSTVFDTLIPRGFLGWGNVSTLGFSLAAAIAAKKAFPDTGIRGGHRRGRPWLHARQPRGPAAREAGSHRRAHQQRRFCRLRPRLLGAGTRPLYPPGAWAERGRHGESPRRPGLTHRTRERTVGGDPRPATGPGRQ